MKAKIVSWKIPELRFYPENPKNRKKEKELGLNEASLELGNFHNPDAGCDYRKWSVYIRIQNRWDVIKRRQL